MTTVFISGSRHLSRLNQEVRARLLNIVNQDFSVVVGDANGADKAVQAFLKDNDYKAVTVFCSGDKCRNNLGAWQVNQVKVESEVTGRAFYTIKDKKMAEVADYGFILWDGKSQGSYNNIVELLTHNKKALVYLAPKKMFVTVKNKSNLSVLLKECDSKVQAQLSGKVKFIQNNQQILAF